MPDAYLAAIAIESGSPLDTATAELAVALATSYRLRAADARYTWPRQSRRGPTDS
ncbi:MAG TPA: hypothetical protein VHN80_07090 [Kineosporiaceae bacterium]|jgi:hypothetical protein|nr:hypothetical protein [Kineosporiaceae bacterium]